MRKVLFAALIVALILTFSVGTVMARKFMSVGGGPEGGTFKVFAQAMYSWVKEASNGALDITPEATGGSAENLRRLNSGKVDFGIVYAGDIYLGSKGRLPGDKKEYTKVRPMGYLYGAPAQLVVRADSPFKSAKDLVDKRVAVGNAGSGAALSAERFFKHLGIWDKMKRQNLGYSAAAADFKDGKLDAFWVLVGYPTAAIIEAAVQEKISLINFHNDAEASGFYKEYPFYTPVTIPANVYQNQTEEVKTFQDSTLLCTNNDVDQKIVNEVMGYIWSKDGLNRMVQAKKTFKAMSMEAAFSGAPVPLAEGAVKFWEAQGKTVPDNLK
jgi:hypothetical protein